MLKVHARNLGSVALLSLRGRMVGGQNAVLSQAVHSQSGVGTVVLDLRQVSTVDARSLGLMLELRQHTYARGIDFKLMNLTKPVSEVLKLTRLNSVFEVTNGAEVLSEGGASLVERAAA